MLAALIKSFGYAFYGLGQALVTERNFRWQWLAAFMASLVIYWANFERWVEMLLLTIIFFVLSLELLNSSIEKLCDSNGTSHHPLKKLSKDFGAASVLLAAILSLIVFFTVVHDIFEPLFIKAIKNMLLPIFWLLIFIGNLPFCLAKNLSPYSLLLVIPNVILHVLFLLVGEGSALFLVLSLIFHSGLILANARRAFTLMANRHARAL